MHGVNNIANTEITLRDNWTLRRVVRNLPSLGPLPVKSLLVCMGLSDFHEFGFLENKVAGRLCAAVPT